MSTCRLPLPLRVLSERAIAGLNPLAFLQAMARREDAVAKARGPGR